MPKTIRVYVPSTLAALAECWPEGRAAGSDAPVFAVLDRHRREAGEGYDEEELEFGATRRAAEAALALAQGVSGDRPIVIAADVSDQEVDGPPGSSSRAEDPAGRGDLRLKEPLPADRVVSFHVDEDLLWYDVTEADVLIAELRLP